MAPERVSPPSEEELVVKRKRKRRAPPDPDAEVIALSPKTLMAPNRFVCEICSKDFSEPLNLQIHRRTHDSTPTRQLGQGTSQGIRKRVYICPEPSCMHHDPSQALCNFQSIKDHFCRAHGKKKWKCDQCSKLFALESGYQNHSIGKTCEYRCHSGNHSAYQCDCGTVFSRKDIFLLHRKVCDALAEKRARVSAGKPGQAPGGHGDHSLGAGSSAGSMSVMGAPPSPRSANVGMRWGEMDPLSVNVPPRPGIVGNLPGMDIGEAGLSMIPALWGQPGGPGTGPTTPGSGTRHSLWSGPGPGPPGLMGGSQLNLGGNSQRSTMEMNSPFLMQPQMQQHTSGVSNLMEGSSDFDIPQAPWNWEHWKHWKFGGNDAS